LDLLRLRRLALGSGSGRRFLFCHVCISLLKLRRLVPLSFKDGSDRTPGFMHKIDYCTSKDRTLLVDLFDFHVLLAEQLLQVQRPGPCRRACVVFWVQRDVFWERHRQCLRHVENTAHIEKNWSLAMRCSQMPEVKAGYAVL